MRSKLHTLVLVIAACGVMTGLVFISDPAPVQAQCTYDAPSDSWYCGDADDTLGVSGTVGGWVSLAGGADTLLIDSTAWIGGSSTVFGPVVQLGDGADSVINDGTISVYPTGTPTTVVDPRYVYLGNGDDILINTGWINGSAEGQAGNDTLQNLPQAAAGDLGGAGGSDLVINQGYVGVLMNGSYQQPDGDLLGGDDNDTVINAAFAYVNVNMDGGHGDDSVLNQGYVGGHIGGGYGSDTVINAQGARAESMHGDYEYNPADTLYPPSVVAPGDDLMINAGVLAGTLVGIFDSQPRYALGTMDGFGGSDTLINTAGAVAGRMEGDAGDDSLVNAGYLDHIYPNSSTLYNPPVQWNYSQMDGGEGSDTVVNAAGGVVGSLLGDVGDDSLVNQGYVAGQMIGGDGGDTLINAAGAFAGGTIGFTVTSNQPDILFLLGDLSGGAGNDSLYNAGYIGGLLNGGDDHDTITNASGAAAGGADLGAGDDRFTNRGYVTSMVIAGAGDDTVDAGGYVGFVSLGDGNDSLHISGFINQHGGDFAYAVDCGAGNDTVDIDGFVTGSVLCGDGDDSVTIFDGLITSGDYGAAVIGTLDGGDGSDTLTFSFIVTVGSQSEATALAEALAAASPAGGTITIAGFPYAWSNFETLVNLLSFNINEPIVISLPRRANGSDVAAPVAIYCAADAVELWTVGADGAGSYAFSVPSADVNAGTTVSAAGVTFTAPGGGSFTVSATASDGKPYAFEGRC